MALDFRATAPSEISSLREFLKAGFNAPDDAPFIDPALLKWKFFQSRDDWPDSRSYVLEDGGKFVAHIGAWPLEMDLGDRSILGLQGIDWLADNRVPGAGALLLLNVRSLRDFFCSAGGTPIAVEVIARSGSRKIGELATYMRPLRPLRQLVTHQRRDWKLPPRLVRNALWALRTRVRVPAGWEARAVRSAEIPDLVLPSSSSTVTACRRSSALFSYLDACPVVRYGFYLVEHEGQPAGYFLISYANRQARLADIWVVRPDAARWSALAALAVRAALEDGYAAEMLASSSLPDLGNALESCGFRRFAAANLMMYDRRKMVPRNVPLHFQMIDNDASYLHDNRIAYIT